MPHSPGPLATALAIDQDEIRRRLDAAGLEPARLDRLAELRGPVNAAFTTALDAFYPLLLTQPELATLLGGPAMQQRLRALNEHHLRGLVDPGIDVNYVEGRLRVGATHHRLHVKPQAYLCALAPLLDEPLHWLVENGEFGAALTLLDRALFDAALALDAYGLHLEQDLRREAEAEATTPTTAAAPSREATASFPSHQRPRVRLAVDGVGGRRAFLGLDDERLALLRTLEPILAGALPTVLDDFYRFFTSHSRTAALMQKHAIPQLQQQVAAYWREFATGGFDRPHAASRMRIGMVHERIGLSPQWYLAGLSRQVRGLLTAIVAARPADASACVRTFVRALLFDVSFVVDAYMESRAETVLRTEGHAARLIASLTAGVAVLDANHRIVSVNRSMLDLLGVDASLLQHMPIASALPLAELPPLLERIRSAPHSRPSAFGQRGARVLRLTAVRLDDGRGESTAIVVDDVTELQHFGTELERQSRETEALVDAVPDMLWAIELPTWTVLSMSRQSLELCGRRDLSLLGHPDALLSCIAAPDRERFRQLVSSARAAQPIDIEHRMTHADGTERWCHTRARGLPQADDRMVIAAATRDSSAMRGERERRLQAIGQLAGGVAHELNNALTVAFGELELLDLTAIAAKERAGRDRALLACRRMANLTSQMLAFAQRQVLQPRDHDLARLLHEWEPELRALLGPNCTLECVAPPDECIVRIDRQQLLASLCQLTTNARDAMPDGGHMVLRAGNRDRTHADLEVVDNGHGMSPEVQARSCEPFFSTRGGNAAGLGLATVLGFARQSGGELAIESTPGAGTRVRLRLPLAQATASPPRRIGDRRQPSLLVVEDDADVRSVVIRVANGLGFRVAAARSAEQALAMLEHERIDALFSDIVLGPGLDGVTLAERVRTRLPTLPIVLSSGYSATHFHGRADTIRHHFLPKPFTVDQLRQTLSSLLAMVIE